MAETPANASGPGRIDALLPPETALACEAAGATKAARDGVTLVALGILAGAFIALGAIFMTVVLTGSATLPWGVGRLLGGTAFSLGLILVIVGGAELFTGDSLMVVACASRRITVAALLRGARIERWQRVALASAKQCGRAVLPEIRVPLTLAIMPTLMVNLGRQIFALPLVNVKEIIDFRREHSRDVNGRKVPYEWVISQTRNREFTYAMQNVKAAPVEDSRFAKPAGTN